MIYFDWLPHKHFGSIRQQIWSFLHFPFHLALVLFMEGAAQFLIWHKIIEALELIGNAFSIEIWPTTSDELATFVGSVNQTTQEFVTLWPPVYQKTYEDIDQDLAAIANSLDTDSVQEATFELFDVIQSSLFTTYGIGPPKDTAGGSVEDELSKQLDVFSLVVSSISYPLASLLLISRYPP